MIEPDQLTAYLEKCRRPGSSGDKELARAAWQAGDWSGYVRASPLQGILDAIIRVFEAHGAVPFDPDAKLSRPLPDDFAYQLRNGWIGYGYAHYRAKWDWVLRALRNSGLSMMTPAQRAAFDALPADVKIWRGFRLRNTAQALQNIECAARGVSWTTDRTIAETYASRMGDVGDYAQFIARAVVSRAQIHTFLGGWHLNEVVVDRPHKIEGIEIKRIPSSRPRAQRSGLAALAGLGTMGFALPRL